jgi:hypothetical protein
MSALGHKQTFRSAIAMSALPPKADIRPRTSQLSTPSCATMWLGVGTETRRCFHLYWAMTNEHAAQPARRNVGLLIRKYLTYLPLIGFLVTLVIALVLGVDDWKFPALEVGLPISCSKSSVM